MQFTSFMNHESHSWSGLSLNYNLDMHGHQRPPASKTLTGSEHLYLLQHPEFYSSNSKSKPISIIKCTTHPCLVRIESVITYGRYGHIRAPYPKILTS